MLTLTGVLYLHMGPYSIKFYPPTGDGATQGNTWSKSSCNSVSQMLSTLNCTSLETRRRQSCLLLPFKLLKQLVYVPENCLPAHSRASHFIQLTKPFARANIYLNSFFPRTISDWNKLHITTLTNVSMEEFKDISIKYLVN